MEKFLALSLSERCEVIQNVVQYYGMGNGLADLSLIGGTKKCGTITKGSKIQEGKADIFIIDRSITGLFEKRTKVL